MIDRFQLGVFSVIYDTQNGILFNHRRDLDLWDLPGGGMNHGELPIDTAIRETKEETGFDIAIDRLVMIYSKPPPQDDDLIFIFRGTSLAAKPQPATNQMMCAFLQQMSYPKILAQGRNTFSTLHCKIYQRLFTGKSIYQKIKNG